MAVTAASVVVSTTPVSLNPATRSGTRVVVRNTHATDALALGGSDVTAATGFLLPAGQILDLQLPSGDQLYAVRGAAANVTAHVLRSGS